MAIACSLFAASIPIKAFNISRSSGFRRPELLASPFTNRQRASAPSDIESYPARGGASVRARGGRILAITSDDAPELEGRVERMIQVPQTLPMLLPVLTTIPLQLLAYHAALMRGTDVDQPRNLAKSVTVE